MPITINTNPAAKVAARALEVANNNLTTSLKKLSTGKRIVNLYDDAAGEAVQQRLKNENAQYNALKTNIQNGISLLETQAGILDSAMSALIRVGELVAMADDSTKSTADIALYQQEGTQLDTFLTELAQQTFNGVALSGGSATVAFTLRTGATAMTVGDEDLTSIGSGGAADPTDIAGTTAANVVTDINVIAGFKAAVGAKIASLNYHYDNAVITQQNIQAARGRIVDLDIASETGVYAKQQVLSQAAAAMLSQANSIGTQSAMQLLLG